MRGTEVSVISDTSITARPTITPVHYVVIYFSHHSLFSPAADQID